MPTRYGRSPWVDWFPKSRIPSYPRHRGPLTIDVAIIGGGLTGCFTAYACAAAGVKAALFEAGRIGQGSSASSAGWLADDPGASFAEVGRVLGLRAARHAWRSWRRAALDAAALLKRLEIKCRLEPSTALRTATSPEEVAWLKREQKARKAAGLDTAAVSARVIAEETALMASAALRSRDGATLDPYRAALGLTSAALARGAVVFEQSPVLKITFTRRTADLFTGEGTIRARRIIVATGMPTPLFKALARHFWFHRTYRALTEPLPARVRRQLGVRAAVIRDVNRPPHLVRWVDGERLLIAGADGGLLPERLREKTIVQRTGQLMYELSTMYPEISGTVPSHGWDAAYARTADGLPVIGPHRNFPHHLFAFGDASPGVTGSYLASRILLRHHLGEAEAADDLFGFR
ncbi:MAG: FAD-dependent oxidoreductase [Luteitalea sp.]|nr:FAD-dependent oxidoreductase [Luteitalea sp.]